MRKGKSCFHARPSALLFLCLVCLFFSIAAYPVVMPQEVERKSSVVDQYFAIVNDLLRPAYKAQGTERQTLFQNSIEALTQLIEWFKDEKDMPTACLAQYQIAKSYQMLGDIPKAREGFQRGLDYERTVKTPMKDRGDLTIHTVIVECKKELESL